MKIAIIGAGFTGLSAAYRLTQKGHAVTIFEKEKVPGGLAIGFKEKKWQWSLEAHYHHWFTNDTSAFRLAEEINFETVIKRPKTSIFLDNAFFQLDSPLHLLSFPKLTLGERIRMGMVLAALRYNPFWKSLESIHTTDFLSRAMGEHAYKTIWEPQLRNKFGDYASAISLAWFWARIKKRTASLAYPKGGYLEFATALVKEIEKKGGKILFNTEVIQLQSNKKVGISCKEDSKTIKNQEFDACIVTLPSFFFLKIAPTFPHQYQEQLKQLQGLGAINLVLRLKNQFLTDGTYWLSVCEKSSPIMAVVEHTNFMDKKYYNNEHIVYLGNYMPQNHPYFKMAAEELLKIFDPFLKRLNKNYESSIINSHLFKAPFAQPIIPVNYSHIMPSLQTPLKDVYLANIQQVYPWDRGTNYAIELGEKIAELVIRNS